MTQELSTFATILKPIAEYVLVPLWFALLIFVITEALCIRRGISLREGVKGRTFLFVAVAALFWLATLWIPAEIMMPYQAISLRALTGIIAAIISLNLLVFYFSELIGPENTLVEMGICAGLVNHKLAGDTANSISADNEEAANTSASLLTLSSATTIFRDLIGISLIGIFMGFEFPPLYFWATILVMGMTALVSFFIFRHRSGEEEAPEYSFFSPKDTILFLIIFIVGYYLILAASQKFAFAGLYGATALIGLMYGGVPAFAVGALLIAGHLTPEAAFFAVLVGAAASLLSAILYAFMSGSKKLGHYLAISGLAAISIGFALLMVLLKIS